MKYSVEDSEAHEVRGLLFVYNHDAQFNKSFDDVIEKIDLQSLPIASGHVLHYLSPHDVQRLWEHMMSRSTKSYPSHSSTQTRFSVYENGFRVDGAVRMYGV